MALIGDSPSFLDGNDPATISIAKDHPAKKLLLQAIQELDRGRPRVAVECMQDAMTAIGDHDDLMVEF